MTKHNNTLLNLCMHVTEQLGQVKGLIMIMVACIYGRGTKKARVSLL